MTDWDGMSEDEIRRRLDEAFARIRAVGEAQEHVWLEQKFAESPEHAWPPMPGTAHPSLERMAAGVRGLMARGEHTVHYHVPRPLKIWQEDTEVDPFGAPDPLRVLNVHKVASAAPWTERPYRYAWRVAVGDGGRWIAAEEVEVQPMYGRPQ